MLQRRLGNQFLARLLQISVCLRLVEDEAFFLKLSVNLVGFFQKIEINLGENKWIAGTLSTDAGRQGE